MLPLSGRGTAPPHDDCKKEKQAELKRLPNDFYENIAGFDIDFPHLSRSKPGIATIPSNAAQEAIIFLDTPCLCGLSRQLSRPALQPQTIMSPDSSPTSRLNESTRAEAFSDGVFAIAITILVLELRVPRHEPGQLLPALLHQWGSLLAYVVSFIYIGIVWMNHHALFARVRYVNLGLQWINLGILLTTALLPFPTGVLAEALSEGNLADLQVAVALYALTACVMSAAWVPIFPYLRDHPELVQEGAEPCYFHLQRMRPWTGVGLYLLGAAVGVLYPLAGLLLFVVMILFHAITSEGPSNVSVLGRLSKMKRSPTAGP